MVIDVPFVVQQKYRGMLRKCMLRRIKRRENTLPKPEHEAARDFADW